MSKIRCKNIRVSSSTKAGRMHEIALEKIEARAKRGDVGRVSPGGRKIIDAQPIMAERRKAEFLRAQKGLVAEWTRIVNSLESDLRAFAQNLMAEITGWMLDRPQRGYAGGLA